MGGALTGALSMCGWRSIRSGSSTITPMGMGAGLKRMKMKIIVRLSVPSLHDRLFPCLDYLGLQAGADAGRCSPTLRSGELHYPVTVSMVGG